MQKLLTKGADAQIADTKIADANNACTQIADTVIAYA